MLHLKVVVVFAAIIVSGNAQSSKWWEHTSIYQVYPRSFKDSNNDGIGDLKGIIEKMSHFSMLNNGGVWLSPIYPSPMKDFGYDISNYTDINPEYGTLEDFDALIAEANSRDISIILDIVPNHSSDEHPWFIKSVNKEPGFEDYYIWKDPKGIDSDGKPIPPNNWLSLFYGSAWEYNEKRGQFYLHQFAVGQPDLNYHNPAVVQEMKDVFTFWMDRGVKGFRIDAIPFLFESPNFEDEPVIPDGPEDPNNYDHLNHVYTRDYQATYDMVRQWRKLVDERTEQDGIDRCIMVEAYASIEYTMKYFGTPEEPGAHFPFNFNFISLNNNSGAEEIRQYIHDWVDNVPEYGHSNWLVGNHDNHRIGSRVGEDMIDAMIFLIFSLPGTVVTYYGEEIGMLDNLDISYADGVDPSGCNYPEDEWYTRSRDFERTPMQWDDSVNAGFNKGAKPWLPVNKNYESVNVKHDNAVWGHIFNYYSMSQFLNSEITRNGNLTVIAIGDLLIVYRNSGDDNSGVEGYMITLINFSTDTVNINLETTLNLHNGTILYIFCTDPRSGLVMDGIAYAKSVDLNGRTSAVLLSTAFYKEARPHKFLKP